MARRANKVFKWHTYHRNCSLRDYGQGYLHYVLPHLASNLLYVYWLSCNYQGEFLSLSFSWYKFFIIGGPLFFSVVHILQHLLWLKNQLPVKMLDDAERIT